MGNLQNEKGLPVASTAAATVTQVDDILKAAKPFGRFQIFSTFLYTYVMCAVSCNVQFMGFGGSEPKFVCHTGQGSEKPSSDCGIYYNCTRANLSYVSEFFSVADEWSLVCDRSYYVDMITSLQMVGVLVGGLLTGPVVDWYGRKWTYLVMVCAMQVVGALSALSPNVELFTAFRFAIGLCTGSILVSGWVFVAETTTNQYRLIIRAICGSLVLFDQTGVAYLTQHWRWFSIVGNVQSLLAVPMLAFMTYESPRWLVQKGRVDEAELVLRNIARFNKTEHLLPKKIYLQPPFTVDKPSQNDKRYFFWHLFKTKTLAVRTTVCILTYFSLGTINYGMFFGINALPESIYVSMALLAAVGTLELPFALYDARNPNLNRKWLLVGASACTVLSNVGVACMLAFGSAQQQFGAFNIFLSVISILGQLASNIAFDTAYMFAIELFPTLLRSNAGALCSAGARIGSTLAPQLLYFQSAWAPLPYVNFAIIAACGVLLDAIFLPNTKNAKLPETFRNANSLQ